MVDGCGTGTGNETGNESVSMKAAGNGSGMQGGYGTDAKPEAVRWTDCWFVDEGGAGSAAGAESAGATDRVGDAAGRWHHLRLPRSSDRKVLAQGEEERTAGGRAEAEEWKGGEKEGGRRGEERSGSGQSCGC